MILIAILSINRVSLADDSVTCSLDDANRQYYYYQYERVIDTASCVLDREATVNGYVYRGLSYLRLGQPEQAYDDFDAALALEEHGLVYAYRGAARRGQQQFMTFDYEEEVQQDFARAVELSPDDYRIHLIDGLSVATHLAPFIPQYTRAFEAAKTDVHHAEILLQRGQHYARFLIFGDAINDFETAWEYAPQDTRIHLAMAEASFGLWHTPTISTDIRNDWLVYAEGILLDLSENVPHYPPVYANLAEMRYYEGELDEALDYMNQALELTNNLRPQYLLMRAEIYTKMREWDLAIADLSKALASEYRKDEAGLYYLLGLIEWENQRYEEAIAYFEEVFAVSPNYGLAHLLAGFSHQALGNPEKAYHHFQIYEGTNHPSIDNEDVRQGLNQFYEEHGYQ